MHRELLAFNRGRKLREYLHDSGGLTVFLFECWQFVGLVAQLGFAAALIGEFLTGKGPLGQIGLETGRHYQYQARKSAQHTANAACFRLT